MRDLRVALARAEVLRGARTAYPLLRDDDLDLVHREPGRLRVERYDLPDDSLAESPGGGS
jgi:hypothetical protein